MSNGGKSAGEGVTGSQEPVLFDATVAENVAAGNPEITKVRQCNRQKKPQCVFKVEMIRVCRLANAHDFIQKLPQVRFIAGYVRA